MFSLARPNAEDGLEMKSRRPSKQKGDEGLLIRTNEHGVLFRSYRDGSRVALTPESSVLAQKHLGADIIIPLDELPPYHIDRDVLERSVYMSHRWEARSLRTHLADVRQRGDVRGDSRWGGSRVAKDERGVPRLLPFDGFAIGGSLGRDTAELVQLLAFLMPLLPDDRPNHLLGIGDVGSILGAIPGTASTRSTRRFRLETRGTGSSSRTRVAGR